MATEVSAKSDSSEGPSVAAHPRAARQVARAKSWGGLAGFVLGGYLSLPTSTFVEVGVRALAAGVVCYLAVWAAAVFIWRGLIVIEIKRREQELVAAALASHPEPAQELLARHPVEPPRARSAA